MKDRACLPVLCLAGLLLASGSVPAWAAEEQERIIFVEPALRTLQGCVFVWARGTTLVCSEGDVIRGVRLASPGIVVWRGADQKGTAGLRRGDVLDIKLELDGKGEEVGTFIWANLARLEGAVRRTRAGRFSLVPLGGSGTAETEVLIDANTQFLAGARVDDLKPNRATIVIGVRLDATTVRATRVALARP